MIFYGRFCSDHIFCRLCYSSLRNRHGLALPDVEKKRSGYNESDLEKRNDGRCAW